MAASHTTPGRDVSQRLAARRRRVRQIRLRVAGLSMATFLSASGAVLVELVSAHDRALARTVTTTAQASRHLSASSSTSSTAVTSAGASSHATGRSSRAAASDTTASRTADAHSTSSRSTSAQSAVSPSAVTTSAS